MNFRPVFLNWSLCTNSFVLYIRYEYILLNMALLYIFLLLITLIIFFFRINSLSRIVEYIACKLKILCPHFNFSLKWIIYYFYNKTSVQCWLSTFSKLFYQEKFMFPATYDLQCIYIEELKLFFAGNFMVTVDCF